jgi:glycosyltransferase involved in cell wall biosynthesis
MKRRIAVIAEYFPPRLGSDRRIFELMKRLSQKYDIHFITLPPSYTLFIRKIDPRAEEEHELTYEKMRGHRLSLPNLVSKLWVYNFLVAFTVTEIYLFFQMLKEMIRIRPNMIIVNDTSVYTGLLGFVCSKVMNKKLLVDYNDLMGLYTFQLIGKKVNGLLQKVLGRMLILAEDILVKHGWKVTAITDFISKYSSTRNVRKDIIVVPNGVDMNLFDPSGVSGTEIKSKHGIRNGEKLCVYTGRVDEVAGAETILETAKLLQHQEKIKFLVVGEGNPKMVNELAKCPNIILTGRVPKEAIPKYLAAADCVFVPFPDNVASHGISPLKLFEALAMEKPVIASAISGIKEAVGEDPNVILVSNDPKCWASAVTELIENAERSIRQGRRSREAVRQKYDFDQLATAFDEVIESGF